MNLFFRVVSLSYKGKEYRYLRLMKSIRQGKKVRQLEIMNLANISHFPDHAVKAKIEDLKRLLSLCDTLCRSVGGSARISFLIALETAFQPRAACPGWLLRDIYSHSAVGGEASGQASSLLFSHIRDLHADIYNGNFILWFTPLDFPGSPEKHWAGFLMTGTGLPVKHFTLDQQNLSGQYLKDLNKDLEQQYGARGILLLINNPQHPDAGSHGIELNNDTAPAGGDSPRPGLLPAPGEFSSVLAGPSILSEGGLDGMFAKAASAVVCYHKFVERMASVFGHELDPSRLLDMFLMFQLFKALMEGKIAALRAAPLGQRRNSEVRSQESEW